MVSRKTENWIIRFGIILFWTLFWGLNFIDKLLPAGFLWVGRERTEQFTSYFLSIGLSNPLFAETTLMIISIFELVAFVFMVTSLFYFFRNQEKAHQALFWGIFTSLLIFSFFTIGDQVFGNRTELLEHSIYWISLVISWFIFRYFEK